MKTTQPLAVLLAALLAPANGWAAVVEAPARGVALPAGSFAFPVAGSSPLQPTALAPMLSAPALALSAAPAAAPAVVPAAAQARALALSAAKPVAAARGESPLPPAPAGASASEEVGRIADAAAPALEAVKRSAAAADSDSGREAGGELESLLTGAPASVFQALTKPQKAAFRETYLGHLRRRNGEPVFKAGDPNLRFTVREKFFAEIEANPVVRTGAPVMAPADFAAAETRRKPLSTHTPAELWAVAVAKANRSERYGVEYGLRRTPMSKYAATDPMRWLVVEEFYHTRVLEDALQALGVKMQRLPPHPVTAMLVRSMAILPKPLAHVAIFCGEVAGVAAFRLLLDQARVLFKDQPEALKRIEACFQQILVDEVGHVHFVRSQLGPVRLWIARKILPLFSRFFLSDMPELAMLLGKKELKKAIVAAEVDAASAEFPDKFVPFPAR